MPAAEERQAKALEGILHKMVSVDKVLDAGFKAINQNLASMAASIKAVNEVFAKIAESELGVDTSPEKIMSAGQIAMEVRTDPQQSP